MKDADNTAVEMCDIIPLRVRLWCTESGLVVDGVKDEVSQATEQDRSGHRRGMNNCIMVSGKASSSLHINHDGRGLVSVRITTTSQLNDRRRFTCEVIPDFITGSKSGSSPLSALFTTRQCKPGDTTLANPSLSLPIEVMSKINKLHKVRGVADGYKQAHTYLEKAITILKAPQPTNNTSDVIPELVTMCKHISNILNNAQAAGAGVQGKEFPKVLAYKQARDYERLIASKGLLRMNDAETKAVQDMLASYIEDPSIIDKLPKSNNMKHRPW